MAKFTKVRVEADKAAYLILLSNGNRVSAATRHGARHEAVFEDPYPKPSYLFAAGDSAA